MGPVPFSDIQEALPYTYACVAQAQLKCLHVHSVVRLALGVPTASRLKDPSAAVGLCVAIRGDV